MRVSLYGNYRTRSFTDIFPSVDDFLSYYTGLNENMQKVSQDSIQTIYYLLYARYGNSHIANSDENQFKALLFSIIYTHGPTWERKTQLQDTLRNLTEAELMQSAKQIYNQSFNPSTAPSTGTLEELTTINQQNTINHKRSKLDAYNYLHDLLVNDWTTPFIKKFNVCFLRIVAPQEPLWYVTELNDQEEIEDGDNN